MSKQNVDAAPATQTISFGKKHLGETFLEVFQKDQRCCLWSLVHLNEKNAKHKEWLDFVRAKVKLDTGDTLDRTAEVEEEFNVVNANDANSLEARVRSLECQVQILNDAVALLVP